MKSSIKVLFGACLGIGICWINKVTNTTWAVGILVVLLVWVAIDMLFDGAEDSSDLFKAGKNPNSFEKTGEGGPKNKLRSTCDNP